MWFVRVRPGVLSSAQSMNSPGSTMATTFMQDNQQIKELLKIFDDLNVASGERKLAAMVAIRLAAIVDSSDDAIIGKNMESVVTSWNKSAERIFGYTAGEMVGTSIMRLIPADRQEEEAHILGKVKRGEKVDHFETQRKTKDGRLIDILLTASPIKDATDNIVGV